MRHRVDREGVPCAKGDWMATNFLCIADELEKIQCENWTQPKHHRQDDLVLAILKGLRTQMQVDGKMEVCSVGPHFTGHDHEPIDEEDIAKFYDDVTGELLPGHLVGSAPGVNQVSEHVSGVQ